MVPKNSSIERIPPQDIDAEQSLLGSLLIDKEAISKIADIISSGDFYLDKHTAIYETILELYEKREPIDLLSLSSRLKEQGKLQSIGGRTYLTTLTNAVPTASHVVNYANIVQRKATLRRMLLAASHITELGYQETKEVDHLLDQAEQELFSVSQRYMKRSFTSIGNVLAETFERIDKLHRNTGELRGLPCGYPDIDNILAGLQRSDLVILAARPSVGKTTFALDLVRNIAIKNKYSVGIFSLEMSKEQLVDRLLCAEANVDLWKMRTGKLSDKGEHDDFSRINGAMGKLAESKIFMDDTANANVMEIRTKARRLQSEHGVDLIVIDYLQLMEGRRTESRVQEVSEISRGLKALARELDVPVLALSQLSRSVESRDAHIPRLSDLRESGSIEQDADVVMFIHRAATYQQDLPPDRQNIADIIIAKHRNGPTGKINLFFDPNTVSFRSLDKKIHVEEEQPVSFA